MTEQTSITQQSASEKDARFRAVVETVVDAIITIDEHGHIDFANPAAERMFGYPPGSLVGRNVDLLMPPQDAVQHNQAIKKYLLTGIPRVIGIGREVMGVRADGQTIPLELAVSEVKVTGRRLFTGVLRDVSKRQEVELQLRAAQIEAEAASKVKSQFLRNMSHELRTPLTPIQGYADLLLEDELPEFQREMVSSIQRNCQHLLHLISRLLEMASIDDTSFALEMEPFEPMVLLRELHDEFNAQAVSRGVTLRHDTPTSLPQVCWTDPSRVKQVLKFVLESALDEAGAGEIHLAVHTNEKRSAIRLELSVTGWHLTEEQLAALFSNHALYDSTMSRSYGIGWFGLPLAQRLAEKLGGHLTAESLGSAGSRFSLHLPLTVFSDLKPQELITEPISLNSTHSDNRSSTEAWQHKRVLLAEDTRENQVLIQHMLNKLQLQSVVVNSGYAALTEAFLAETSGEPFDLVLMDIQMPGLNGWDATRRLRSAGLTMPILALTALAAPDDQQECLRVGCQEVLTKPVSFSKFSAALQHWLTVEQHTETPAEYLI